MFRQGEIVRVIGSGHFGSGTRHALAIGSECVVVEKFNGGYVLRGPHKDHGRRLNQIVSIHHIQRMDANNASLAHLLDGDY